MPGDFDPAYVRARSILLDALEALSDHSRGLVLVGAHAVYLHTGNAGMAVAEYTTDADLAIDPDLITPEPRFDELLRAHGFERGRDLGRWQGRNRLFVDLLVPEMVAGRDARRSADLGTHGRRIARRVAGLEPCLVDNQHQPVAALDEADQRVIEVSVAGPAALLIAKAIKIEERITDQSRLSDKDALDALRLLRATETAALASSIAMLRDSDLARDSTLRGIRAIRELFGEAGAPGSRMAARAVEQLENPHEISSALSILTHDLLSALNVPGR